MFPIYKKKKGFIRSLVLERAQLYIIYLSTKMRFIMKKINSECPNI